MYLESVLHQRFLETILSNQFQTNTNVFDFLSSHLVHAFLRKAMLLLESRTELFGTYTADLFITPVFPVFFLLTIFPYVVSAVLQ